MRNIVSSAEQWLDKNLHKFKYHIIEAILILFSGINLFICAPCVEASDDKVHLYIRLSGALLLFVIPLHLRDHRRSAHGIAVTIAWIAILIIISVCMIYLSDLPMYVFGLFMFEIILLLFLLGRLHIISKK